TLQVDAQTHSPYGDGFCLSISSKSNLIKVLRIWPQVGTARLPLFTNLDQDGRHQTQTRSDVREEHGHPGTPPHFPVEPLQAVGCANPTPVRGRKAEHRQTFWDVLLQPSSQARGALGVLQHR